MSLEQTSNPSGKEAYYGQHKQPSHEPRLVHGSRLPPEVKDTAEAKKRGYRQDLGKCYRDEHAGHHQEGVHAVDDTRRSEGRGGNCRADKTPTTFGCGAALSDTIAMGGSLSV